MQESNTLPHIPNTLTTDSESFIGQDKVFLIFNNKNKVNTQVYFSEYFQRLPPPPFVGGNSHYQFLFANEKTPGPERLVIAHGHTAS